MADLLQYKAKFFGDTIRYYGTVEYSDKEKCLMGRLTGIRKSITYYGFSVSELQANFEAAIEAYFAECYRDKRVPETPYKGGLSLRLPPKLHRDIGTYALKHEENINSVIIQAITEFLEKKRSETEQSEAE